MPPPGRPSRPKAARACAEGLQCSPAMPARGPGLRTSSRASRWRYPTTVSGWTTKSSSEWSSARSSRMPRC
eukprot:scaffold3886_cov399-Prasinococcus_capsulatus_cf.AAC.21